MNNAVSANKLELVRIAEAVAREKDIDKQVVLQAMEEAIQRAARSRYGSELDIRAHIDPKTGETKIYRVLTVVDEVEDEHKEITLDEARRIKPDAEVGDELRDELPPIEFGRIAAQSAKQVIVQRVREAERERQYNEYKDRVGEIASGVVKRAEYGNVIVDLNRAEAIIPRREGLPREHFQPGDRVRAYIYEVKREQKGPQIFLSRTRPEFMAKLFAQEVPEIYDGTVEIVGVARDPGSRAKIAVRSHDPSIDPVGACVGMRGSRVQAVVNELGGEKIDIIQWTPDVASFVVNALAPAEVAKIVLDEDANRIDVVVPEDQQSLAIGRRGQNVRLASQLVGWDIDIMTEEEEAERRQREFQENTELFMKALDVDEMLAQLLASEGFTSVEELAWVDQAEIAGIEGLNEEFAEEIQSRAREYLEREAAALEEERQQLGVEDAVLELPHMTPEIAVKLGREGIKTVEDVAYCAVDDLVGWRERKDGENVFHEGYLEPKELSRAEAEEMIMTARVRAGLIEEQPEEEGEEAGEAGEAGEATDAAEAAAAESGGAVEGDAGKEA